MHGGRPHHQQNPRQVSRRRGGVRHHPDERRKDLADDGWIVIEALDESAFRDRVSNPGSLRASDADEGIGWLPSVHEIRHGEDRTAYLVNGTVYKIGFRDRAVAAYPVQGAAVGAGRWPSATTTALAPT
ncbi:hypothetical protein ABZ912_60030 [Nonomuraea angiospora]|uniref:hypothetical protein n=1 Tax=Nonomuraea angiospora TaxID=46172 RepID=UPI00340E12D6